MASLQLPKSAHSSLKALNDLSDQVVESIWLALSKAKPSLAFKNLVSEVVQKAGLTKETADPLISTLVSMYSVRSNYGVSLDVFVADVVEGAKTAIPNAKETNWEPLKRHLSRLLSLDQTVGITAKALDVMTEHDNVFIGARLFTDLRPIFLSDASVGPAASTVVHTLKIDVVSAQSRNAFFVAMDGEDVRKLQHVLNRALEKERTLKKFSDSAGLQCLDVEALDE